MMLEELPMRRFIVALAASACLGVCGCFMPLGVVYPTVSHTPSVPLKEEFAGDLHAFRIDFMEYVHAKKITEKLKCELSEIDLTKEHDVPSQTSTGLRYYWALFFVPGAADAMPGSVHSRDSWVRVRLYRRGFKTIEIGPDSTKESAEAWEKASDLKDLEEAIDALIGAKKDSLTHLPSGHTSRKHEDALNFAAAEYLQLVNCVPDLNAEQRRMRTRLLKKYNTLRELALD
jgi:hypothetical protein